MKTIKVKKQVGYYLDEYKNEGESYNDAIVRLLDESEPLPVRLEHSGHKNLKLDDETYNRLLGYKAHPKQTFNNLFIELFSKVFDE